MSYPSIEQIEQAHEYMKSHWINGDEGWSDFAIMDIEGDTEMLADALVSAGAIDSSHCYEDARPIERVIEQLARSFRRLSHKTRMKRISEVFKGCLIISCNDCNSVSFVHSGNERLYPELLKECWECRSANIDTKRGLNHKGEAS